jgi:hypothetical protein
MNKYFIPYFGLNKAYKDLRFDLLMCESFMTYHIVSSLVIVSTVLISLSLLLW